MKHIVLTLAMLFSMVGKSQTITSQPTVIEKPFIEVTGIATKEIMPNKIYLSITLKNKIIDKQQYNIQLQEEKLKKVLAKNNIDIGQLTLSDASSEIITRKSKEIGFEVKEVFTLLLANATQLSAITKELQDLNIKETSIIALEHSNIDSLKKEVRIAAIKAAKSKAQYLVQAIGEELDKPIEIKETTDGEYRSNITSVSNSNSFLGNVSYAQDIKPQMNFEKIKISFSYYIKYGIK